ncbi:DUF4199 family protein [Flavobacterium agricola]|uniref:DUF4199 family protein n=1 Tax=Flavobacterium agricola TaxID=2870839 RepID=A0ABY6M2D6_9FLAO|nr:DUF4199 family protein [Flavobacterium agricola]UYW01570.1 DUF4199 family protein [Flavobacterium agricola]
MKSVMDNQEIYDPVKVKQIVQKNGVFYGLIMGGISVLICLGIYLIDYRLFLNPYIGIVELAIYAILGIMVVWTTRQKLGNAIIFKDAFTTYFIAGAIGSTISVIFYIIIFNVVAPEIQGPLKEMSLEYSLKMANSLNLTQEQIDAMIIEARSANPYTVGEYISGLAVKLIGHAMYGAFLGLIFRNRQTI